MKGSFSTSLHQPFISVIESFVVSKTIFFKFCYKTTVNSTKLVPYIVVFILTFFTEKQVAELNCYENLNT